MYIQLISPHGLVRLRSPELGRDADTGGQVRYVVGLARALSRIPGVWVDLFTRMIRDPDVPGYRNMEHDGRLRLVRLPCGPDRYLPKEELWGYLDEFAQNVIVYTQAEAQTPAAVHGHYADGGTVALKVAEHFDAPMVFTAHSLGAEKRRRLSDEGVPVWEQDRIYRLSYRIAQEFKVLKHAAMVVASSHHEAERQYAPYGVKPSKMLVNPPGIDDGFPPVPDAAADAEARALLHPFLRDPAKPLILGIARPVAQKRLADLANIFGASPTLRENANLAILAGYRDATRLPEHDAILDAMERHNLYGAMAFPKRHEPSQISRLYGIAARTRGLYANIALREPFGMAFLEASACGLPFVAHRDGGAANIVNSIGSGILFDAAEPETVERTLAGLLKDRNEWTRLSINGTTRTLATYSWRRHCSVYLRALKERCGVRPVGATHGGQ